MSSRPDVRTEDIIRLYATGMSSPAVAAELGCCSRTVLLRLRAGGVEPRGRGKFKPHGPDHRNWKGQDVTYDGAHIRVNRIRGRPSLCERCGTTEPRAYEWANLTGNYPDVQDYARMCIPCHRRFDYGRRKADAIEAIRNSTESQRALERRYGIDHRVIRRIRTEKP